MRRRLTLVSTLCLGLGLLALGAVVGLVSPPPATEEVPSQLAAVITLLVVALSVSKLVRRPSEDGLAPAPWTDAGAMVDRPPESTPDTDRISGTAFTEYVAAAAEAARSEDTVDAGLNAVREPLREALVAALTQGGWDDDRIDAALSSGSWTDDPVAAAVVDERVSPPVRSLRRRVWAWLFPAKAVRHRTARTVGAIADAADTALPPVVGQHAPRPVPIAEPTVEDLRRAADGTLRRAVEGSAATRRPDVAGEAVTDGSADRLEGSAVADDTTGTDEPEGDTPVANDWDADDAGGWTHAEGKD